MKLFINIQWVAKLIKTHIKRRSLLIRNAPKSFTILRIGKGARMKIFWANLWLIFFLSNNLSKKQNLLDQHYKLSNWGTKLGRCLGFPIPSPLIDILNPQFATYVVCWNWVDGVWARWGLHPLCAMSQWARDILWPHT